MEVDNIIFIIFSPHNKQILENRSPAVRVRGPLYLVLRRWSLFTWIWTEPRAPSYSAELRPLSLRSPRQGEPQCLPARAAISCSQQNAWPPRWSQGPKGHGEAPQGGGVWGGRCSTATSRRAPQVLGGVPEHPMVFTGLSLHLSFQRTVSF